MASLPASLDDGLAALRGGGFVVVTDDEARENEADLVLAADNADYLAAKRNRLGHLLPLSLLPEERCVSSCARASVSSLGGIGQW